MVLILLTLWNNMGHIHSYFFNMDQAKICLKSLQDLMQREEEISELTVDDYIVGALSLYMDIISIFLEILSILESR